MKISDFRLLTAFCAIMLNAFGAEVTMTIQPPLIQLGESAVLSIEVRNAKKFHPPALPDIPELRIVGAGQSEQNRMVNFRQESSSTTFIFQINPRQTGTFTIGPFDYKVDGETKTLQGGLKVVAASGDTAPPQSRDDMVFARLAADRESAYVQEPFGMTLSIYSRQGVQLAGSINLQGMPETGLGELQWQEIQPDRQVISNTVYDVRRFFSRTRAVSAGRFEFTPTITVQVAVQNQNNRSRSPFNDPFFGSMFNRTETRPVELQVEKAAVEIKPLPEAGRPSGFSGAVGQFQFKTDAQPLAVHPGDPITLTMTVSGDGNFDRISSPALPDSGLFRLYGEPVRKQADKAVVFEQAISPRTDGVTEIPPVSFSFFDTQSGEYRMIKSSSIPIEVKAASNSTAQVFAAKDSIVLPPPEMPFATESDLQRIAGKFKSLWQTLRPWLWTVPSALGAVFILLISRHLHHARQRNTARIRRQKAPKAARHALRTAAHARRHNDAAVFYDALWNALADYFGHRFNLSPGDVTPSAVLQALVRAGVDPEYISALREIFEQVDACRYGSPDSGKPPETMAAVQLRLEQMLKQCERTKF